MAFWEFAGAIESLAKFFHSFAQGEAAMVIMARDIVNDRKVKTTWTRQEQDEAQGMSTCSCCGCLMYRFIAAQ
jgi:hypothetical protein